MIYAIRLTNRALYDFENIYNAIYDLSNDEKTSQKYIAGILKKIERLIYFPYIGVTLNGEDYCIYRFLEYKKYLIIYYVDEKEMEVYIEQIALKKQNRETIISQLLGNNA